MWGRGARINVVTKLRHPRKHVKTGLLVGIQFDIAHVMFNLVLSSFVIATGYMSVYYIPLSNGDIQFFTTQISSYKLL